ncbi:MAG: monovalent cation/H+ antiporter subunit D family protein, partial [Actinomycetes bacterium]|nr:monovalent cation/H+ antiporter subunit D family protein [Actinomycetes bacterium]
TVLAVIAAITIVYGSTLALFQVDLKKRLAFSTVSQVSYIVLGIAVGGAIATTGGMVHLVHQGLMKITLFFAAGIFATLLGVTRIDQLDGVGRRLPWTSAAFTVGALGMIGLPPIAGFISKWHIGLGAVDSGQLWVVGVLVTSTLLNAAYFLPLLRRMWLAPRADAWPGGHAVSRAEVIGLVAPAVLTAAMALAAGVLTGFTLSPLTWVIDVVEVYVP